MQVNGATRPKASNPGRNDSFDLLPKPRSPTATAGDAGHQRRRAGTPSRTDHANSRVQEITRTRLASTIASLPPLRLHSTFIELRVQYDLLYRRRSIVYVLGMKLDIEVVFVDPLLL